MSGNGGRGRGGRGGRYSNKKGKGSHSKKTDESNGSSKEKDRSSQPKTIDDVRFDVGDSKNSARIQENFELSLNTTAESPSHGDTRHDVVKATREGAHIEWQAPKAEDAKCLPTFPKKDDPDKYESVERLLSKKHEADEERHVKKETEYQTHCKSIAITIWLKCTEKLKQRMKDNEDTNYLKEDVMRMKAAVF